MLTSPVGRLASRSAMAVAVISSWVASAAFAQSGLPPVVVTANRVPTRIDQTLADVTVIDRSMLDRMAGRTLAELLTQQPGVQMTANGGLGKTSSIFLRGAESRHTLLLIDGVRYNSATSNTLAWDNLPVDDIERIEIVRGPMSGLYGSDAVGGVVQVFTRQGAAGFHPRALLTAGSGHYLQASTGARFGQADWDGSFSVQHTETRGFSATNEKVSFGYNPDRDRFRQDAAKLQVGLKLPNQWRTDFRWLYSDGLSAYDDGLNADARAQVLAQVLSWSLTGPVMSNWKTTLRVSESTDENDTLASAFGESSLGPYKTQQQQITWENSLGTPYGTLLLLAEQLRQKVSKPGQAYDVSERTISSVGAGLNGQQGAHTWQANLRSDHNSQFGSETHGTLGYGYAITPEWRAAASLGSTFVAPSFNQLYFPNFGNPLLQPERGTSGELSLRWVLPTQQWRLAYFENHLRGFLASSSTSTTTSTTINIPRAEIKGWALTHEIQVADWTVQTAIDHVNPRNKDVRSNGTLGGNYDKLLPRRAKDTLKLAADLPLGLWSWGGTLMASGERFDNASNSLRLPGYALLDLRADWRFAPQWSLGLRLNNVGDKRYETARGYNQAGREGFLTLRYTGL